jgi:hypothetical protein
MKNSLVMRYINFRWKEERKARNASPHHPYMQADTGIFLFLFFLPVKNVRERTTYLEIAMAMLRKTNMSGTT